MQVVGSTSLVVPRDERGAARPGHGPGADGRPDRVVPAVRAHVRVAVRRAPGTRGRGGLGGGPRGRAVLRVLPAVVPVLQPARPGQGRPAPSAPSQAPGARSPAAGPPVRRGRRVPGVLRAVRAALDVGQGERHIRHGRVHRVRAHAEAQVHKHEQGEARAVSFLYPFRRCIFACPLFSYGFPRDVKKKLDKPIY